MSQVEMDWKFGGPCTLQAEDPCTGLKAQIAQLQDGGFIGVVIVQTGQHLTLVDAQLAAEKTIEAWKNHRV